MYRIRTIQILNHDDWVTHTTSKTVDTDFYLFTRVGTFLASLLLRWEGKPFRIFKEL